MYKTENSCDLMTWFTFASLRIEHLIHLLLVILFLVNLGIHTNKSIKTLMINDQYAMT